MLPVQKSSSIKVRKVIKQLEADSWYFARTKGSHRQFKHPDKLNVAQFQVNCLTT
ncbi:type II toxin-antitoxin system HicA family toxin [Nostoc sp.]|uniref:type II toxin-antitoxin system HicA family toxin n=1 Tax=Nostoc sp. TaxID=1180 RepID=UPI003FA52568